MCYVCLCSFRSFPCFRIRSKDNHTLSQNAAQAEWCLKNFARRGNGLAFCAEVAGILLFLVLSSLRSDSIFSLCLYYSVDSRNMFQNGARKFDFHQARQPKQGITPWSALKGTKQAERAVGVARAACFEPLARRIRQRWCLSGVTLHDLSILHPLDIPLDISLDISLGISP